MVPVFSSSLWWARRPAAKPSQTYVELSRIKKKYQYIINNLIQDLRKCVKPHLRALVFIFFFFPPWLGEGYPQTLADPAGRFVDSLYPPTKAVLPAISSGKKTGYYRWVYL